MNKDTIGIDISKDTLDTHRLMHRRGSAIRQLRRWLARAAALDRGANAGPGGL